MIIGAGATGSAFARHLREVCPYPVVVASKDTPSGAVAAASLAFFMVKAYDLAPALEQWLPRLPLRCAVVVTCNGAVDEIVETFRGRYRDLAWRRGVVTFGAREVQGEWQFVGESGALRFGSIDGSPLGAVEEGVVAHSKRVICDSDILSIVVEKWIWNVAINTVAAAFRLPRNGDIIDHYGDVFSSALKEAWTFATERWSFYQVPLDQVEAKAWQVLRDTADNENSMAADARLGRQTEHAYLGGMIPASERYPTLNDLAGQLSD